MDSDHQCLVFYFSIVILVTGCSFDIVKESESSLEQEIGVDVDPLDPFEPDNEPLPNTPPAVNTTYLGSCYEVDRREDDEYCVDLESETDLNPAELRIGQTYAEEFCGRDNDLTYIRQRCADLNNMMNEFKPVIDNNNQDKLCDDKFRLEDLRVKAFHILADRERGRLEYDSRDRECERRFR